MGMLCFRSPLRFCQWLKTFFITTCDELWHKFNAQQISIQGQFRRVWDSIQVCKVWTRYRCQPEHCKNFSKVTMLEQFQILVTILVLKAAANNLACGHNNNRPVRPPLFSHRHLQRSGYWSREREKNRHQSIKLMMMAM
jgi:hypothetical protein